MKIGLVQMNVMDNKNMNLKKARNMVVDAHNQGAEIVMLPEMFNTPYQNDKFSEYAEDESGKTLAFLRKIAGDLKILLIGGSIPEREGDKIYNTSYIINEDGDVIGKHRKVHLFDIDVKGGITFFESHSLTAGDEIAVVDTSFGKIGVAICYDIRFPELFRKMVLDGARYLFIPAAFNTVTGPAHWEILTRARALDNQVYLAIASPARSSESSYKAYGHSLIVDPWGEIVDQLDEKESILVVEIDPDMVDNVRGELPILKHRKPLVYE